MRLEFALFAVAFLTQKFLSQKLNIKITSPMMYIPGSTQFELVDKVFVVL